MKSIAISSYRKILGRPDFLPAIARRAFRKKGRSEDSICLVAASSAPDGAVITGDTLFVGGCGRVDLPGGSARDLYGSLFGVLGRLDGALAVYPGHDYGPSPTSTLGRERRTNFALQPRTEDEFVAAMGGGG